MELISITNKFLIYSVGTAGVSLRLLIIRDKENGLSKKCSVNTLDAITRRLKNILISLYKYRHSHS